MHLKCGYTALLVIKQTQATCNVQHMGMYIREVANDVSVVQDTIVLNTAELLVLLNRPYKAVVPFKLKIPSSSPLKSHFLSLKLRAFHSVRTRRGGGGGGGCPVAAGVKGKMPTVSCLQC